MKNIILIILLLVAVQIQASEDKSLKENETLLNQSLVNNLKGKSFVTVGDQPDCDFHEGDSRLQDAIDSGTGIIRVSNSVYMENLLIDDTSIMIIGGYATCADATNDVKNGSQPIINGSNAVLPVVRILGDLNHQNRITLDSLKLTGGVASHPFISGGVSIHEANIYLELLKVDIIENTGVSGGGFAAYRGEVIAEMQAVSITHNKATKGGGIYCNGPESVISVFEQSLGSSQIAYNEATSGDGGGVFIKNGCTFFGNSGTAVFESVADAGIHHNKASRHGGGIAIQESGQVYLFGTSVCDDLPGKACEINTAKPVNVNNNVANNNLNGVGNGGGIYATGPNAQVLLVNSLVNNNSAFSGGGIALENKAILSIGSLKSKSRCWTDDLCSQINGNKTAKNTNSAVGGGVLVSSGSSAHISRTELSGNSAGVGAAIYNMSQIGDETLSVVNLDGALVVKNGDHSQIDWDDSYTIRNENGLMRINFTTIADNDVKNSSANIFNLGEIEIYNSIIHNADGLLVLRGDNRGSSLFYECLILNELDTLPRETDLDLADPMFVDRSNGNYHLNAALSPAVDFCNEFEPSGFNDVDDEVRGIDDPNVGNIRGPFDVGFDETNDFIFSNSFSE